MEIEIFADEIYVKDKYVGIGCLFVPVKYKDKFVNKLINLRCLSSFSDSWFWEDEECDESKKHCSKTWHNLNNCEIHFQKLRKDCSDSQKKISKRWMDLLINNNKNCKNSNSDELIYFKILYFDLDKLDDSFFGETKGSNNKYNRFFRTVIMGGLNYFFMGHNISVKEIFHDKADDKEMHDFFPWYTPVLLNNETDFNVQKEEITFIDSDHKNYEDIQSKENSQFIQFIDLILGCTTQALFKLSDDEVKKEVVVEYYPLLERLWKNPNNKNSSYNYFMNQEISIFPKDKIRVQNDLFKEPQYIEGQFHRNILLREPRLKNEQENLDKYFNLK